MNPPPNKTQVQEEFVGKWRVIPSWAEYFSSVYFAITALQQSGTTAQRPIKGLYIGRPYFDTTLNRPIWYTGTNWIRADGVVV